MGLGKKTIDDQNYCGKKVLVRCDFNVPMKDGVITNENRINAALPTIQKLVNDGAKVILCSHLGKPKNGPEAKFSLAPVAVALSAKLGKTVVFADDDNVVGENAKAAVAAMNNGDVVLLQNTRFRKEETKNMPEFSEELASLADAYVDDAFGSCHRAHCSTAGVTDYIKDTAVGYLMEKEIKYLGNAVNDPVRPFTAILGGAKVADKLNVISNLLEKVDTLIIGGGMAYTFVKAQGYEVGKSLCDDTKLDYCKEMMAKAQEKGVKLLLPVDAACIKDFPDPIDAPIETVLDRIEAATAHALRCKALPVILCGEHSVSLGALRALAAEAAHTGEPFGVVQFDAHADLRSQYEGSIYSPASVMHRAVADLGLPLAQFAMRDFCREEVEVRRQYNVLHYDADVLFRQGLPEQPLPADFPRRLYITCDVDGLDASLMPATGTPSPGGLFWHQALLLIECCLQGRSMVGMDVVELAPLPGLHHADFTAAKLTHALMGFAQRAGLPRKA